MPKKTQDENQMQLEMPENSQQYHSTTPDPKVIDSILKHYRSVGFPYQKLRDNEIIEAYRELRGLHPTTVFSDGCYKADSTGVSIPNSYHPHRYGVVCNNKRTALFVFGRDHLLKKAIQKCVKMQGGINDTRLRSMLSIFEGVQVASNFPPGTAKVVYESLLKRPGKVWDMSCGFGGRLIAALSTDAVEQYYGTEPSTLTYQGLREMVGDIERLIQFPPTCAVDIAMQGSEYPLPSHWQSVDLCFTSPPYFDTEKYSREESQSFLRYPYRTQWIHQFIGGTLENCSKILKPDGLVAINIANVNSFQNLEQSVLTEAIVRGFELVETRRIEFAVMPGQGKRNRSEENKGNRTEPLFIFKRRNKELPQTITVVEEKVI